VTPIVTLSLAVAASQLGHVNETVPYEMGTALRELGVGAAVGALLGAVGALVLNRASRHGWIASGGRRLAALALAISALTLTLALDGNGFIAGSSRVPRSERHRPAHSTSSAQRTA
jgi:NhaP-type Na+/H+ or K+/H+ antiporter